MVRCCRMMVVLWWQCVGCRRWKRHRLPNWKNFALELFHRARSWLRRSLSEMSARPLRVLAAAGGVETRSGKAWLPVAELRNSLMKVLEPSTEVGFNQKMCCDKSCFCDRIWMFVTWCDVVGWWWFCGGSVSDAAGGRGIGCQIGRTSPWRCFTGQGVAQSCLVRNAKRGDSSPGYCGWCADTFQPELAACSRAAQLVDESLGTLHGGWVQPKNVLWHELFLWPNSHVCETWHHVCAIPGSTNKYLQHLLHLFRSL